MNRPALASKEELRDIARRAMIQRGLLPEFSPAALAEMSAITRAATEVSPSIRDLRGLPWASIDNDDSRDLDQLSVAVPAASGAVKILVAIADVDSTVRNGSAIDGHARVNTTSVYTAAEIFPMLPEKLSTDLTSLGEDQERLAIAIEMTVGGDGAVTYSDVYRAVVLNHAKLAYDGVAAWLDGAAPPPPVVSAVPGLDEQLRIQDQVAQRMKRLRTQHGALDLETIEARPVFEDGVLTALRPDEKNRAKALIEDFMIAANGVTARYLERKGFPSFRRVLRSPERWARIVDLAAAVGEHLPPEPSALALEGFLTKRRRSDPARFADLSLSVIKLLGSGEYALELPGEQATGHFGLAVQDYTHSTAPNRRFPDLVTQRMLKAALAGRAPPYGNDELAALARHCTEQEGNAAKVERQVLKSAAALLLAPRIGERFDAIVTGASEKGTWVRISRPPVEGKVVRGFERLDVGDRLRVELVHTDVEHGFIDFVRAREGT
ncbi:RNB domain-containing ribonuclease [Anaeromyxobacter oryzae]|uniref:Ribonuclease II n=1 Tax=Anaeromyxobacter oryzae TaxID=2918170 RepID=A0ABN6MRM8_9BACT|nr:RNB domain-containing ribonuclease [Anaeromyxobacter oryzae]BDG02905.1 ribonuclease II [Anaeromyxobacter oryzae]